MDAITVREKLIAVLQKIQLQCGFGDGQEISGRTIPLDDLEGFDSKLAPIALGMLAIELGIDIPKNANPFGICERHRTVDEIVEAILEFTT